jgi:hypothetical protein
MLLLSGLILVKFLNDECESISSIRRYLFMIAKDLPFAYDKKTSRMVLEVSIH